MTAAWPMYQGDQRMPGIFQSRLGLLKLIECAGLNRSFESPEMLFRDYQVMEVGFDGHDGSASRLPVWRADRNAIGS